VNQLIEANAQTITGVSVRDATQQPKLNASTYYPTSHDHHMDHQQRKQQQQHIQQPGGHHGHERQHQ